MELTFPLAYQVSSTYVKASLVLSGPEGTVSLPFAWTADNLPLGVQLAGIRNCEHNLLAAAAWLESVAGFAPRALPL